MSSISVEESTNVGIARAVNPYPFRNDLKITTKSSNTDSETCSFTDHRKTFWIPRARQAVATSQSQFSMMSATARSLPDAQSASNRWHTHHSIGWSIARSNATCFKMIPVFPRTLRKIEEQSQCALHAFVAFFLRVEDGFLIKTALSAETRTQQASCHYVALQPTHTTRLGFDGVTTFDVASLR